MKAELLRYKIGLSVYLEYEALLMAGLETKESPGLFESWLEERVKKAESDAD